MPVPLLNIQSRNIGISVYRNLGTSESRNIGNPETSEIPKIQNPAEVFDFERSGLSASDYQQKTFFRRFYVKIFAQSKKKQYLCGLICANYVKTARELRENHGETLCVSRQEDVMGT